MGSQGPTEIRRHKLLLVGTGGNGIGVAAELKQNGIDDFRIISRHSDFGGAWHANGYPGCYTDVPSMAYQMTRKIRGDWPERFASRAEMGRYLRSIATENDLYAHTDFDTEMLEAEWLDGELCWQVSTSNGVYLARFLLTATGYLDEPNIPKIPGLDSFPGRVFHSSLWPADYTGSGDVVAVVGTGSSGAQIVPALQKIASRVVVLQRTATYILPRGDLEYTDAERHDYKTKPDKHADRRNEARKEYDEFWEAMVLAKDTSYSQRMGAEWHAKIDEFGLSPALQKMVTPDVPFGFRRPIMSDDYYRAIGESNVDFVAGSLHSVDGGRIKASTGQEFNVDAIAMATGFKFLGATIDRIKRRDGVVISKHQQGHLRAYKAVTPAMCPNLFLIGGSAPNSMCWDGFFPQAVYPPYVMEMIKYMDAKGIRAMEVREEAEIAWKRKADSILEKSPFSKDPNSFMMDATGHNKAIFPGGLNDMRDELSTFDPTAYDVLA
ncbi:hypothetical protein BJY01DRAFT_254122 [Aspergillus pseudoustus]|uniref:FAD/NAD(P)-binding domain-containing protein n=1 Tax=Aspergillus pseudoustus TaxID=1810923 RepID=A0ABR4IVU2_9EURO